MSVDKLAEQFYGKHVFITGGAGFIGSHLLERLMNDCKITLYDNLHRNSLNMMHLPDSAKLITGDVLDYDRLKKAVKSAEIIYHLAAIAGITSVTKSPTTTMKINLLGTYNLIRAIQENNQNIERFVLASTSEVYGKYAFLGKEGDMTSQGPVSEPRWCYATSKLAAEHLVHSYFLEYNIPVTSLRYFNIYGPRQTGESAMHNFVEKAIHNEPLIIFGEGLQVRSWCHVLDCVEGTLLATLNKKAIGRAINIGNPKTAVTIAHLAELVTRIAGSRSKIVNVPKNFPDVELRVPDITLAKELLGFYPKIDLQEGIRMTIEWFRMKVGI